jgi:hypothetical protein
MPIEGPARRRPLGDVSPHHFHKADASARPGAFNLEPIRVDPSGDQPRHFDRLGVEPEAPRQLVGEIAHAEVTGGGG